MRINLGNLIFALPAFFVLACGSSGGSSPSSADPVVPDPEPTAEPTPPAPPEEPACEGTDYESTWAAIQDVIFEQSSCVSGPCHGEGASGGLDLRPEVAYENLLEAPSAISSLRRVEPGDKDRSVLFLKLAAKTDPDGGWPIGGGAMPTGSPAISENALEALRLWIYSGAPEEGTVTVRRNFSMAVFPRSARSR